VGKMPLRVELLDAQGQAVDLLLKHDDGRIERPALDAPMTPSNWP
jgi:hypothetical protein